MSNQIYDNRYYNEEQKTRFLSWFEESTQTSYKRVLSRAYDLEEFWGKDLYDFNQLEIEQLVKYLAPTTTESAHHAMSIIQMYIRWAIEENLRVNNINPLDSMMDTRYIKRLINTAAQTLFNADEVFGIVDSLVNFQDKAVVMAIFEGINVSELLNIKITDIDEENNMVTLRGESGHERQLEISDNLKIILIKAYGEKTYYKKNGNISKKSRNSDIMELVDSPYVIRHSNTNTKSDKSESHTISRRLKMIAELSKKYYFNPTNVRNSGMLYIAMQRYQANQSKGLTQQDYYDITDQFNTSNKDRYSYAYLKRSFLNDENIKALYAV